MQALNALERCLCTATPLFQLGELCGYLRCFLLQFLALLAKADQLRLLLVQSRFRRLVLGLETYSLLALLFDDGVFRFARVFVAGGLYRPVLQAALNTLRFSFHLLKSRTLIGSIMFGVAALVVASFKLCGEFLNRAGQGEGVCLGLCETLLQPRQLVFDLAQFALQRQGTFTCRLASGDRCVVKALALRVRKNAWPCSLGKSLCVAGFSTRYPYLSLGSIVSSDRSRNR